jgi:hypothetical protein
MVMQKKTYLRLRSSSWISVLMQPPSKPRRRSSADTFPRYVRVAVALFHTTVELAIQDMVTD